MSYSSVVLGDAPVAYWRLQETSGTTAVDSSGNANNGTYTGGYTLNQSTTGVQNDVSALFDGSSGEVSTTFNPTLTASSIEFWCNFKSLPTGGSYATFVAGTGGSVYEVYYDGTNLTFYNAVGGVNAHNVGCAISLQAGTWHHIVATSDPTAGLILYVDGVSKGSNTTYPVTTSFSPGNIAISVNPAFNGNYFDGYIQEVAIYNKALTATQVANHYSAATGGSSPTPITASGAFQGQGSLSATANIVNPATINATASFTGQGSLTATANLISPVVATASMQGQGSLTATGNGVWLGSASLTGQGSLSSNPVVVLTASASLSGQGNLTAVVELQDTSVIGTANFYGSSSVVSNPTVSKAPILATANMQGQGSLTATVEVVDIGVANLQGTSYLMANAVLPSQVQVPKVWNVVFDPKKSWTGVFDKTIHTWTVVFDPKKVWVGGE